MRVLPKAMREPVSLGYLLARASDTLADTEVLDARLRSDLLNGFESIIEGGEKTAWFNQLENEVIPHQTHPGERVLLENMQGIFQWLENISPPEIAAIHTVMKHILRGQKLDIERFELQQGFRMTRDDELDDYCYLVAGCVGEFWTDVGGLTLTRFSETETAQLREWGANYGKGLQLINILRDLPNDLNAGRCYLPNVDPSDLDTLLSESARWRERARAYLRDGASYASSLVHRRTRAATALPGLIGLQTLDLMEKASWEELSQGVKISRHDVYRCAWDAFIFPSTEKCLVC